MLRVSCCRRADTQQVFFEKWVNSLTVGSHAVERLVLALFPVDSDQEKGEQRNEENRNGESDVYRNVRLSVGQVC